MAKQDLTTQIAQLAADRLVPGETIDGAVKGNAPTSLKKALASAGAGAAGVPAGIAGMAIMQARAHRLPSDEIFGVTLPADIAVASTDRQLIVCARGGFMGKLKSVAVCVPLSRINEVESGTTKISGITVGLMGLVFDDGSSSIVTFAKPDMADGERFVAALAARINRAKS